MMNQNILLNDDLWWNRKVQRLHACVYIIQPRNFTGWDSEGVKETFHNKFLD